ncbi:MAG: membrane protein [Clostridiaceae bacterium BRH_c20a]|nr:MAG: membrane protein [Clostridiaceae bacterium BRH_c20a]
MLGTIVNFIAIIVGSVIGIVLKKGIPERYKDTIMQGIGLATFLIGLKMGFKANNELIVILSLVIGGIMGEILKIDYHLDAFGEVLQKKVGSEDGDFVKGFVSSSLIFCIGAMAILGAIESGLLGNHKILFAKSALDFITSIVLSSSLGLGVMFSSIPVFIYQGSITLLASGLKDILIEPVVNYMTATGGMLIVGIGINILGIKKINVANLLPAIFVAVALVFLVLRWFPDYI